MEKRTTTKNNRTRSTLATTPRVPPTKELRVIITMITATKTTTIGTIIIIGTTTIITTKNRRMSKMAMTMKTMMGTITLDLTVRMMEVGLFSVCSLMNSVPHLLINTVESGHLMPSLEDRLFPTHPQPTPLLTSTVNRVNKSRRRRAKSADLKITVLKRRKSARTCTKLPESARRICSGTTLTKPPPPIPAVTSMPSRRWGRLDGLPTVKPPPTLLLPPLLESPVLSVLVLEVTCTTSSKNSTVEASTFILQVH
mmetsp:Transcript_22878/g.33869  ORF Transcript_22878/g.33869 Transcript_22878/m.33869 type:complete len:254 (+) Transcript_22878:128-889(+)